jgi:uncharacterized membrane protein
MSTDTDSDLPERVGNIEGTLSQMNQRVGTVEQDVRALRGDVQDLRRELRLWFVALFVALSAVVAVFQFVI